jgi:hypothetical protein
MTTEKRPPAARAVEKRVEGIVADYMRHSGCTLEQAQHRVGRAEISGKVIVRNGIEYKIR